MSREGLLIRISLIWFAALAIGYAYVLMA